MPTNQRVFQTWQRLFVNVYMLLKIKYINKSDRISFVREITKREDILPDCQLIDIKRQIILPLEEETIQE